MTKHKRTYHHTLTLYYQNFEIGLRQTSYFQSDEASSDSYDSLTRNGSQARMSRCLATPEANRVDLCALLWVRLRVSFAYAALVVVSAAVAAPAQGTSSVSVRAR